MRVAVDANVLIAGTVFPRWPHEILMHALAGDFTLVLSPIVIREARRRIRREFPEFESHRTYARAILIEGDLSC